MNRVESPDSGLTNNQIEDTARWAGPPVCEPHNRAVWEFCQVSTAMD